MEADLWRRVVVQLRQQGLEWPDRATPADVARLALSRLQDSRVATFVWKFLYPRRFGHGEDAMSESEAIHLVEDLEEGKAAPPARATPAPAPDGVITDSENCHICGSWRR